MAILKDFRNLSEGEKFRQKYTFEEAIEKINNFDLSDFDSRRDLAQLINGFITGYKAEVEQDNDLAQKLVDVINNECKYQFFFDSIHNGKISYEPMAANVANLLVDEISKDTRWPDDFSYRMPNKRLFASIDGKEQIDLVKAYVSAAPSPNSRYLAYAAFSNPNFGEEYRNQLFRQTMENVSYIGAYFTNATPEMEAFCSERLKDLLSGKRTHNSIETELSYIRKDCPSVMSAESVKKIMSEMTEKEKCNAANVIVFQALTVDSDKGMMQTIIAEVENTEIYKKASDPLNDEPSKQEEDLVFAIKDLKDELNWIVGREEKTQEQPTGKDEVDEVL